MTRPLLVVIVARAKPAARQEFAAFQEHEALRNSVHKAAESQGWETLTFRLREESTTTSAGRRQRTHLLEGWDAETTYRLLHERESAVVQVGTGARVRLHPTNAPDARRTVTLEDFVRHKGFYVAVNGRTSTEQAMKLIADSIGEVECSDERDARCLPMHVFAPGHDHSACPLHDAAAVDRKYGSSSARTDPSGRQWNRPTAAHGRDEFRIRSFVLRAGFHWDVRGTRDMTEVVTTTQIWKLPRGAYVNVSPNAHVRGGQSSAQAHAAMRFELPRKRPKATSTSKPKARQKRRRR